MGPMVHQTSTSAKVCRGLNRDKALQEKMQRFRSIQLLAGICREVSPVKSWPEYAGGPEGLGSQIPGSGARMFAGADFNQNVQRIRSEKRLVKICGETNPIES